MSGFEGLDVSEYSYAHEQWDSGIREMLSPERALWCGVIHQAFTDAQNGSRRARDWLLCGGQDFVEVCMLAALSPFCVRMAARRHVAPFLKPTPVR